MNLVYSGYKFSHRGLPHASLSAAPHCSAKKTIPALGSISVKKQMLRKIPSNDRTTKEWAAIAWPTSIQSKSPDGQFGPAKQMEGWGDCWFTSVLEAVANDQNGRKILADSIKKVNGGYNVTFKGSPITKVFIANIELQELLNTEGGDADTRLMELAAERFFQFRGNFRDLLIAAFLEGGNNQSQAERCFQDYCQRNGIQDPMHYNPMRVSGTPPTAFFMLTGMVSEILRRRRSDEIIQSSDVMRFLNRYITNGQDGTSVVIKGGTNPLGDSHDSLNLVIAWDLVRTDIARDGRLRKQQRAFLNALNKWLATRSSDNLQALRSAADKLNLEHIDPEAFVETLARNQSEMNPEHFNLLRSGVQEVLAGGPGYIGFTGNHCGTIKGINEAGNTFAYSEPNYPTVVHTGELSALIEAIRSGQLWLNALEPTIEREDRKLFKHAGQKRARHLKETHNQVVSDGKIDATESGPLAGLVGMDDGAFRQAYDTDQNGVIEGGELKAVQLRVDQWVDHFKLTPIW